MTTTIPQDLIAELPENVTIDDCEITTIAALEAAHHDVATGVPLADDTLVVVLPGWTADDGNAEIEYRDCDDRRAAGQQYVDGGDWGDRESTSWVKVYTWRDALALDDDGEITTISFDREAAKVTIEPIEPDCEDGQSHDWQSPIEVVGGLDENPGVFGSGGGVKITEVCRHCGCYRDTDTWAQDMSDGEQGLTSVSYREPDDESLAWAHPSDEEE